MRTRTTTAALAAGLLLALTACGNSDRPSVTKSDAKPEPTATTSSPTPSPTPTDTTFTVGETAKIGETQGDITVTVLAYTQPVTGPHPPEPDVQGGDVWATIEAKVCNVKGETISVSQFPWSLAYADGTLVEVTGSSGGDMPKPEFPMDAAVKAGRCVKGKIPFPVMNSTRPERVVYAPESLPEPIEWTVPST
jgi:hypothetical protein